MKFPFLQNFTLLFSITFVLSGFLQGEAIVSITPMMSPAVNCHSSFVARAPFFMIFPSFLYAMLSSSPIGYITLQLKGAMPILTEEGVVAYLQNLLPSGRILNYMKYLPSIIGLLNMTEPWPNPPLMMFYSANLMQFGLLASIGSKFFGGFGEASIFLVLLLLKGCWIMRLSTDEESYISIKFVHDASFSRFQIYVSFYLFPLSKKISSLIYYFIRSASDFIV